VMGTFTNEAKRGNVPEHGGAAVAHNNFPSFGKGEQ